MPTLSETGTLPSGVTFADNGNGTGTLSGTPAAGTGGVYHVTFTASNGVSPNATQNFTLTVKDFSFAVSPSSVTVPPGNKVSYTITVAPINGFTGTVALSCSSTVAGSSCSVLPSSVTLGGTTSAVATVMPPKKAADGKYAVTFTGASGSLVHTANASLTLK
jgi:large repetitive protein